MPTVQEIMRLPVFQRAYAKMPGAAEYLFASTSILSQVGSTMTRTTSSNPSWRKLIAKRQDASAYYLVEKQEASTGSARCSVTVVGGPDNGGTARCLYNGCEHMPTSFTSVGRDSALQDLALTRLKRKLKTTIGSVQILAPTAEVRELHGMINQIAREATNMVKIMIDIKRKKGISKVKRLFDTADEAHKKAAEAWLAFNFGIRPLVDDVGNLVRSIEDYLRRQDFGIRESASAKKEWFGGLTYGPYTGTYGAFLKHAVRLNYRLSYRWYCGGATRIGAGNHYGLSEHLGISSDDILPALWELTPYSWVVDYFTTIGVFLDDIFWVLPGIMSYSGCTRRFECNGEVDNFFIPWDKTSSVRYEVSSTMGQGRFKRFEFERVPFGANLPHVGLHVRSFDDIGYYGVTKLLNLASVLVK